MDYIENTNQRAAESSKHESSINMLSLCADEGNEKSLAKSGPKFDQVESEDKAEKIEKNLHSVSREVAAKPEDVWKEIGKFDPLPWHPAIESGKVENINGVTTRTLVAQGGNPVFVEQLTESGPNFLRYKMTEGLPLQPTGTLKVESNGNGGSKITWEAEIDGSKVDKQTADAVTAGVMNFYAAGLDNLQKRFGKAK